MMAVNSRFQFGCRGTAPALFLLVLVEICAGTNWAQGQNPSSAANPFYGSVTVQPVTSEPLKFRWTTPCNGA